MFDNVNTPDIMCPECNEKVDGFQSKSLGCTLDTVDYKEVDNFYNGCWNCCRWISYSRKENVPDNYLDLHFELDKREKQSKIDQSVRCD